MLTGASVKALLILALFIGVVAGKELVERRLQGVFLGVAGILLLIILFTLGTSFTLLGVFLCYEVLTYLRSSYILVLYPLRLCICAW